MIMGASHVTVGCEDLDVAAAAFSALGYRAEFIERGVPSHPSKRALLASPAEVHDLCLFRSEGGFAIEAVRYDHKAPDAMGRYIGLFVVNSAIRSGESDADAERLPGLLQGRRDVWRAGVVEGIELPAFLHSSANEKPGLKRLLLGVAELEKSCRFWGDALGLKLIERSGNCARLRVPSPVPAWRLDLDLFEAASTSGATLLDARGMACLAFLSSRISEDVGRLAAAGARLATEIFELSIAGKTMSVAILTAPDGALVELVQLRR